MTSTRTAMTRLVLTGVSALALVAAGAAAAQVAPGAPGKPGTWAFSGKQGIGTSYETYRDSAVDTGERSEVWFSLAKGSVTEVMYGLIHQAQIKEAQVAVLVDGRLETAAEHMTTRVEYLHTDKAGRPLSLAYRVVNRAKSGAYEVEQHVFTDPDADSLVLRISTRALTGKSVTPYLIVDPHMASTSGGDSGEASVRELYAGEGSKHLVVRASRPFARASVGFDGVSDARTDLADGRLDATYATTGDTRGNVVLAAELAPAGRRAAAVDVVFGFGDSREQAAAAADATLKRGYREVLAHYNGVGRRLGWEDYLASLSELPRLQAQAADGGKLVNVSALVLKAQEDKTYPGALIASLSNPWGDTASAERPQTGYKAVWPRDFYQVASAMLALGDKETPVKALEYLPTVQVPTNSGPSTGAGGWFMQKAEVDGTPEWVAVQLDQTAMPIMLGYKLWQAGLVTDARIGELYGSMLKPAAEFLAFGGTVGLDWNKDTITPPRTQQERWEEQGGYSPSTTASVVAGLITAGEIAEKAGDPTSATRYRAAADHTAASIESLMFTTRGSFTDVGSDGRYFLRITQNANPNDRGPLESRNGQQPLTEDLYLDAGFLELVRYGVRRADDPYVLESLPEIDSTAIPDPLRVRYDFTFEGVDGMFPGWRRYGNDGYGENAVDGSNYGTGPLDGGMAAGQRGRVWPFFTGERGHYELARALVQPGGVTDADLQRLRGVYVKAMELFANDGLMLAEQVWDGVGAPSPHGYAKGEGTNSATPLAWTHAEYVKLLRSLADRKVWDGYDVVAARYAGPEAAR
jgi:glucoamylase